VEIWLDKYDLAVLKLQQLNELEGMAGGGGNAGPGLHVADHIQTEVLREIREGAMVGHDLAAAIRLHFRVPFLLSRQQPFLKILESLLKECAIRRVQVGQFVGNASRD